MSIPASECVTPLTEELRNKNYTTIQILEVPLAQEIGDWDQNAMEIPAVVIILICISFFRGI